MILNKVKKSTIWFIQCVNKIFCFIFSLNTKRLWCFWSLCLQKLASRAKKEEKVQHVWKIRTKNSYYQELDLVVEWIKHFGIFFLCVDFLSFSVIISVWLQKTAARLVETTSNPAFDLKFWHKFVKDLTPPRRSTSSSDTLTRCKICATYWAAESHKNCEEKCWAFVKKNMGPKQSRWIELCRKVGWSVVGWKLELSFLHWQ